MVANLSEFAIAAPRAPLAEARERSSFVAPATSEYVLDNRWRLVHQIGAGRWTAIYRARPADGPAHVSADYVIKLLRTEEQESAVARAALVREAQVGRDVSHPNLAALLDCHLQRPPYYLVFPYVEGPCARELVDHRRDDRLAQTVGRLAIPHALWLARQTAGALAALHARSWLHGDLKPDNLVVSPQGHATLLDLGLARRIGTDECRSANRLAGSFLYLAPEALVSEGTLTPASDVYSLGVTLWELLTGKPPMPTTSEVEIAAWHLRGASPDIHEELPQASLRLARLLRRMLAKEPLRRPSVSELIDWLAELEIETLALR